ncbi:MAG: hypothetical protein NT121_18800, partial [Chloroflexi bacterium]|nr:hypothetical protein [Chloroflexota bacterium]
FEQFSNHSYIQLLRAHHTGDNSPTHIYTQFSFPGTILDGFSWLFLFSSKSSLPWNPFLFKSIATYAVLRIKVFLSPWPRGMAVNDLNNLKNLCEINGAALKFSVSQSKLVA